MALSFAHNGVLVIVMDMDNIDRILHNDPFVFDGHKVPVPLAISIPLQIMVCYASKEEQATIRSLTTNPKKLFTYLTRGWKVGPGDSDENYKST